MAPKAKVAVSVEWFVIVKTNEPEVIKADPRVALKSSNRLFLRIRKNLRKPGRPPQKGGRREKGSREPSKTKKNKIWSICGQVTTRTKIYTRNSP